MFKLGCSVAKKILGNDGKGGNGTGGGSGSGKSSKHKDKESKNSAAGGMVEVPNLNDLPQIESDPRIPLNARQIFKISKSWKAIARTMSKTGTAMFLNLFEQNQDLFYLFDRFQHLKGTELQESMELREHAATVMSTLDESINSLNDYDNFVAYLHSIGELHRKVPGFKRAHFWKIEQPFMKAVKQTLDERCNETIEEIYKIAIKLIIETIADGYGEDTQTSAGSEQPNSKHPGSGDSASNQPPSAGGASGALGPNDGSQSNGQSGASQDRAIGENTKGGTLAGSGQNVTHSEARITQREANCEAASKWTRKLSSIEHSRPGSAAWQSPLADQIASGPLDFGMQTRNTSGLARSSGCVSGNLRPEGLPSSEAPLQPYKLERSSNTTPRRRCSLDGHGCMCPKGSNLESKLDFQRSQLPTTSTKLVPPDFEPNRSERAKDQLDSLRLILSLVSEQLQRQEQRKQIGSLQTGAASLQGESQEPAELNIKQSRLPAHASSSGPISSSGQFGHSASKRARRGMEKGEQIQASIRDGREETLQAGSMGGNNEICKPTDVNICDKPTCFSRQDDDKCTRSQVCSLATRNCCPSSQPELGWCNWSSSRNWSGTDNEMDINPGFRPQLKQQEGADCTIIRLQESRLDASCTKLGSRSSCEKLWPGSANLIRSNAPAETSTMASQQPWKLTKGLPISSSKDNELAQVLRSLGGRRAAAPSSYSNLYDDNDPFLKAHFYKRRSSLPVTFEADSGLARRRLPVAEVCAEIYDYHHYGRHWSQQLASHSSRLSCKLRTSTSLISLTQEITTEDRANVGAHQKSQAGNELQKNRDDKISELYYDYDSRRGDQLNPNCNNKKGVPCKRMSCASSGRITSLPLTVDQTRTSLAANADSKQSIGSLLCSDPSELVEMIGMLLSTIASCDNRAPSLSSTPGTYSGRCKVARDRLLAAACC